MKKITLLLLSTLLLLTACGRVDTSEELTSIQTPPTQQHRSAAQVDATTAPTAAPETTATTDPAPQAPTSQQTPAPQQATPQAPAPSQTPQQTTEVQQTAEIPQTVQSNAAATQAVELVAETAPAIELPDATVHAKTGYVEPEPTPEPAPEPTAPADRQVAIDAANAYAVSTYGVETDTGLTLGNSAYRFPAAVPVDASQTTLEAKARDMVDFTFRQLMMQAGVDSLADAGFRCSVTIVEDGGSLLVYVLYDG